MFSSFWDKISSIVAPMASRERLFHHWIEVNNQAKARALLEGREAPEEREKDWDPNQQNGMYEKSYLKCDNVFVSYFFLVYFLSFPFLFCSVLF